MKKRSNKPKTEEEKLNDLINENMRLAEENMKLVQKHLRDVEEFCKKEDDPEIVQNPCANCPWRWECEMLDLSLVYRKSMCTLMRLPPPPYVAYGKSLIQLPEDLEIWKERLNEFVSDHSN